MATTRVIEIVLECIGGSQSFGTKSKEPMGHALVRAMKEPDRVFDALEPAAGDASAAPRVFQQSACWLQRGQVVLPGARSGGAVLRAGASGGPVVGRPRCSQDRLENGALGDEAVTLRRPPQGQASASSMEQLRPWDRGVCSA